MIFCVAGSASTLAGHFHARAAFLSAIILLTPGSAPSRADESGSPPDPQSGNPPALTSARKFPENLGRNFLALFSKKNVLPLAMGGGASAVIHLFDEEIHDSWGVPGGDTPVATVGGRVGAPYIVYPVIGGLFVGGHFSKNERFHSFTYSLAQAAVLNEGLVQGLKAAVGRTRPDGSDNKSFPSGHAASSFMIATVLHRYYGTTVGAIGYSAATIVSFSRIRKDVHWASDLMAGATVGYIVGSTVSRRTGITLRVGKVTFVPAFDPFHRAVGFSLHHADE